MAPATFQEGDRDQRTGLAAMAHRFSRQACSVTLSHNDFALLEPDQVTIVYPSGNEVRDENYRLVPNPRLSRDKLRAAMQEMSRFFH